jgi:hypothetical protein
MFKESRVWQHRASYFRPSEYLLVDKGMLPTPSYPHSYNDDVTFLGYPLTPNTIRPFSDHDLTNNAAEARRRKKWNMKMSSARQCVEHAFGQLKGRFGVLRGMPGYKLDVMYKYIESLLVLHNILERLGDDPEGIPDYDEEEDALVQQVLEARRVARTAAEEQALESREARAGVLRRKVLLEQMFG